MSLRTVSSRKRRSRNRIRNETVETVIICSFETLPDVNGVPHTLIVKLLNKSDIKNTLSLRISRKTAIRVVHRPDDSVYFYRNEWESCLVLDDLYPFIFMTFPFVRLALLDIRSANGMCVLIA